MNWSTVGEGEQHQELWDLSEDGSVEIFLNVPIVMVYHTGHLKLTGQKSPPEKYSISQQVACLSIQAVAI